jgi:hypothetical protein
VKGDVVSRADLPDDLEPALERELAGLEAEAADAPPGRRALFLGRAGDLCLGAGQRARALGFYGRSIDGYLSGAHYDAAASVCRKVLRISPRAVRTRATLAWLAVGKGLHGNARREIDDYVRAAVRAGEERRASRQLALMAQATLDPDLRRVLAEHLARTGAVRDAERIMRELAAGRDARTLPSLEQQEKLWEQVLHAALMGPQELDSRPDELQHPPDVVDDDEE